MYFRVLPWKRERVTLHQLQIIQRLIHRCDSKTASPRTEKKDSVFLIHVSRICNMIFLIPLILFPFYRSICLFISGYRYTHMNIYTHIPRDK